MSAYHHKPVLLNEVVAAIEPKDNAIIVDGTFGAGGYSKAFLAAAACQVFGIDQDPDAIEIGRKYEPEFGGRLVVIEGLFSNMGDLLGAHGVGAIDGVALDVGVSSMQLDQGARGFSFSNDGALDMRMSQAGVSAADVVNNCSETDIASILFLYGEERRSRRVAKAIVDRRQKQKIESTAQLASLVEAVLGRKPNTRTHPATKTFQALRIFVNDELRQLALGLSAAEGLLRSGGKLCVVSFHSLEDRLVKRFLAARAGKTSAGSRHAPEGAPGLPPSFQISRQRAIKPTDEEVTRNTRARSARLRSATRTSAAPWKLDMDALGVNQLPNIQVMQ
jgi:16S rRNA (cytosine1402-N4)-methyltransferase